MFAKIFERKAVAAERLLRELFRLLCVQLLLRLFDQRENVAHAENAAGDTIWMKRLERVILFPNTQELDGLSRDVADRECSSTAGVAVHLCQNHTSQTELVVKFTGRIHRVLSRHRVGYKQDLLRTEQLFQELHLVHQLIVNV